MSMHAEVHLHDGDTLKVEAAVHPSTKVGTFASITMGAENNRFTLYTRSLADLEKLQFELNAMIHELRTVHGWSN